MNKYQEQYRAENYNYYCDLIREVEGSLDNFIKSKYKSPKCYLKRILKNNGEHENED